MKLTRSEPILFERADGTSILAQPCTRGRMREVLMLDLDPLEDASAQRGAQVAIFLRDAVWLQNGWNPSALDPQPVAGTVQQLLESLDYTEEIDIIHAITVQHHGYRPADAVALQQSMREILKKKLASTPQPT